MKLNKITLFALAAIFMIFTLGLVDASAAGSANIRFVTDTTSVDVGNNVEVRIEVEADTEISEFETAISYNPAVLTFVSGGDFVSGADGYLRLSDKLSSGGTTRSYALTFTVAGEGDSEVAVSNAASLFDMNYEEITYAFAPVTITGVSTVQASSDASLKSIKLSPGTMETEFSPEVYEYKINIPYENDFIVISAEASDENAKIAISGVEGLKTGWNTGEIVVTAPAGNTQSYTLLIYRMFEDEESVDGEDDDANPEILEAGEELIIVEEEGRVYLSNSFAYEIVELEDTELIPDGYKQSKIDLFGTKLTAYVVKDNPKSSFMLFYAANLTTGETDFYQYDKKENTIQRFNGNSVITQTSQITVSEMSESEYEKKITGCTIIIALLAALLAVVLVFAIKLYIKTQDIKFRHLDVDDLDDLEDLEDDEVEIEEDDDDDILL